MNLLRSMMCACIISVSPAMLCAQQSGESQETLFSGNVEHGGYGVVSLKVSPVLDKAQLFTGGYGGWFINHTLMVGLGGYGLTSNISLPNVFKSGQERSPHLNMGYGGFMLEYTHNSNKLLHFNGNLLLGVGGAGYSWSYSDLDNPNDSIEGDAFFVGELGVNVELNVASFARVSVGGSYRFVNGVDMIGIDNKELSGPSGNINFKFGKF